MVCVLGVVTCVGSAAAETAGTGTKAPFQYMVVASVGEVTDVGDGSYTIVLKKEDIEHVIEISQDPFEVGHTISANEIAATWKPGAGKFGEYTMGGRILAVDTLIAPINITAISKSETDMRWSFFMNDRFMNDRAPLPAASIGSLKSFAVVNYCCHPDGGGPEWLWGN